MYRLYLNAENCSLCIIIGFNLLFYQMGFSRNRGPEGKEMRAASRSESQWVGDICLSCAPQSFPLKPSAGNAYWILDTPGCIHTHLKNQLQKDPLKKLCVTSWQSTFHNIFMNEGVRTREEVGMSDWRRKENSTYNQPTMSVTFKCLMFKLLPALRLGGGTDAAKQETQN